MMLISPIETSYGRYRFRSRTEARWAVFFDALGIQYAYELDAFPINVLGAKQAYLPDFWLPRFRLWWEVKGQEPSDSEMQRVECLVAQTDCMAAFISIGQPCYGDQQIMVCHKDGWLYDNWGGGHSTGDRKYNQRVFLSSYDGDGTKNWFAYSYTGRGFKSSISPGFQCACSVEKAMKIATEERFGT